MKFKSNKLSIKVKKTDKKRVEYFLIIIFITFSIILLRLFYMQIIQSNKYNQMANSNSIKKEIIKGYRGKIYSAHGKLLVDNVPTYKIVYLNEKKYNDKILTDLSNLLGYSKKNIEKRIKNGKIYKYTGENVIVDDLSKEKAYQIMETSSDYPYISIKSYLKRFYIYDSLGSHIIGYVNNISPAEYKKMKDKGYEKDNVIGKQGIEKHYESELKGEDGYKYLEVNVKNRYVRTIKEKKPKSGDNIYLTIDYDLQKKMTNYMKKRHFVGAFIALDPNNGKIITMVSNPEFSLKTISRKMSNTVWNKILYNKERPLENRVITGRYPPGSIFKIIPALAFMEQGLNPNEIFFDPGYYQIGKWRWRSWKSGGHGYTNLTKSLVESVNYYYYRAADKYGNSKIIEVGNAFGLGKLTGIDIPGEKPGVLPTPSWKEKKIKEHWYTGDTINLCIGQGYLLVTPIQMVKAYSILANKGFFYQPHLVDKILTSKGKVTYIKEKKEAVKYSKKEMRILEKALIKTVEDSDGTAKRLRTPGLTIAAKTGSAQNSKYRKPHSWTSGYFPEKHPKVVFTALVEGGGSGGIDAAEVSKYFVDIYMKKNKKTVFFKESYY